MSFVLSKTEKVEQRVKCVLELFTSLVPSEYVLGVSNEMSEHMCLNYDLSSCQVLFTKNHVKAIPCSRLNRYPLAAISSG